MFIDEPAALLDAVNPHAVIDLFAEFAERGATVVVSTHDNEMITACAHRHELNHLRVSVPHGRTACGGSHSLRRNNE
ncbi:ATP-binding cassette domain-containing protein [Devriesea agamarum]|uniref:ATP-binding cassette domain-containing protein n=1 Tax=Devriesea agamarum TaxID=472569 RepID=UPI00155E9ED3|nr:ABC transporter ATP-binding protein [Devriesea agamarum]